MADREDSRGVERYFREHSDGSDLRMHEKVNLELCAEKASEGKNYGIYFGVCFGFATHKMKATE